LINTIKDVPVRVIKANVLKPRLGESSASRPGRFTPEERIAGTHLVGTDAAAEAVWIFWRTEEYIIPTQGIEPRTVQRVAKPL